MALSLSYEQRIEHKLWKVRQTAFLELGKLFGDYSQMEDPVFANIIQR